jgi:hypothetical protein
MQGTWLETSAQIRMKLGDEVTISKLSTQ